MRDRALPIRLAPAIALVLLVASCASDPVEPAGSTAGPEGSVPTAESGSMPEGSDDTSADPTGSAATTTLPMIDLPPLEPDGPRDVTGTGGPRASYTAVWQIRPEDEPAYGYVVVKDGTDRTAYRFADVLYVDDIGLDYVCVGLDTEPRCAVAADSGANTLVVDGARVRVQELGPFDFTNLAFIPQELGSDAPGLKMSERVVNRLPTSCVTITDGHSLARFAGAEYCETTTNVVAWFDRTGDGAPEVELSLYDPEVDPTRFEPALKPVDDPTLFAELVSTIGV